MGSEGSLPKTSCGVLHKDAEGNPVPCPGGVPADAETDRQRNFCGQCRHHRRYHEGDLCTVCPAFAGDHRHAFVKTAEPECDGCDHAPHGSLPCPECSCGHPVPEPEAHEHDWSEWGAVYHGGHLRWRKCFGCIEVQSTPEGHFCPDCAPVCESPKGCHAPSACWESCAFGDQLRGIRPVPRPESEPEAPECKHTWSDWQRVPSPYDSHWENRRCSRCGAWDNDNIRVVHNGTRGNATPPRRPPYAVAYALASGELYEVALPGDAVATAEGGVLKISHAAGVAHIIQVKPMETT